ncbi:SPOR domain-containing protein [Shewanella nanhaiensis]|uniref:SPOR domain-containing protein n=1 Tax=Shewanella nanhaiensis TaxID=2864872 RepID=A0ABS7DXU9_9GAMM|nr:SPOR domain-containing protein [Shewanella nanhaiensis]MBW8182177.1 SPOR domain-containing protein [Shewanella nanhaiensis]
MSSHFQNRLVGVIVLVALGVIFLPDILDGKKEHQAEQFAEIPLRPEVESLELPDQEFKTVDLSEKEQAFEPAADELDQLVQEIEEKEASAQQSSTQVANKAVVESKPVEVATTQANKPAASAYTLQLGSFKNASNVNGLVKQLREKGFTAYTLPEKPVDGQLTKVFVGPNVSKAKLQAQSADIKKITKLSGRIVSYVPTAS